MKIGRLVGSIGLLKVQICQPNRRRGGNVGKKEVVPTFPWVWDFSGNNTSDGIDLGDPIITTGEKNAALKAGGDELN